MKLDETMKCPECGGVCHLLTRYEPGVDPEPGDVLQYRCAECGERFDIVVGEDVMSTGEE
jgi:DNA-directed RNA polymerase subunit RPC12/RpoP